MAACLLILVTSTLLFNAGLAQICLKGEDGGPEITRPTPQMSFEVEANILHFNYTLHVFEYLDFINNLARVDVHSSLGEVNTTIMNYNKAEVSHIMTSADGKKSCFAIPLARESSQLTRRLFGTEIINGTAHVVTILQTIGGFSPGFNNWTYIGTEMVRGIPCYRWQSCHNTSSEGRFVNFTMDLYFTQPNWSSRPRQVLTQFIVNGTVTESNGSTRQLNNIYSFLNFKYGLPDDDDLFRVPPGQPCQGRQIGKKLPPLPNDYYSVLYENVNPLLSTISYFKVICIHLLIICNFR